MAEWSLPDLDCPMDQLNNFEYANYPSCYQQNPVSRVPHNLPPQAQPSTSSGSPGNMALQLASQMHYGNPRNVARGDNPREIRNKMEKMRRDRLNQSVAELANMVPPVVAARRKVDKTTVLRLTAHYLRAHQYVFGDSGTTSDTDINPSSMLKVLSLFNGFLITTTYRGIIVVVSQNVEQYLGYSELDLYGQNLLNITHEDDRAIVREQLMPRSQTLGPNGELVIPDEPDGLKKVKLALAQEKKNFIVRLKKLGQRSEPGQYVTCHFEGSMRKSDRACRGFNRCCQIVRRARARTENPCASGNDIVFIGVVRPMSETFINESAMEAYRMEYRTRHSIDGEIIQCESRIALVTGYMMAEVSGVNAMNFMHRNDVRWVIIALREMYDQHRLFGESCYRLMTKNGEFIYMRTRGRLDVDQDSKAVTSFVCTNTVVTEEEGKHLIKMMRKKFTLMVNNAKSPEIEELDDETKIEEVGGNQPAPVEDPRRLEQVILHLVNNLPSPPPDSHQEDPFSAASPEQCSSPTHRLTIIPPNKERIVSAIEKIYNVISFPRDTNQETIVEEVKSGQEPANKLMITETPAAYNSELIPTSQVEEIVPLVIPDDLSNTVFSTEDPLAQSVAFNGTENQYITETMFSAVTSPDMGYFDASPSAYSNITSMFTNLNQNGEEFTNQPTDALDFKEIKYDLNVTSMSKPLIPFYEESNVAYTPVQPSTGNANCGTKRPCEFEDLDKVNKKKVTEEVLRQSEPATATPTFYDLFDDKTFDMDAQIEAAIQSMDNIDPRFPDLLTSADIQGILETLETEANQPNLENKDLFGYD